MTRSACLALSLAFGAPNLAVAEDVTVSAAISLKPALEELAAGYQRQTRDTLTLNFGSSGSLQRQIENGAPVDLFISAGTEQMNALEAKGLLLSNTRRDLLGNSLVLVVAKGAQGGKPLAIDSLADLKGPAIKRIAIGDPRTVPAGQYAEQSLRSLKLDRPLAGKLILAGNVRQVLTYVETRNVDAGLVYASDASGSSTVVVAKKVDPATHSPIVYPLAVLKASRHLDAARRLAAWLTRKAAARVFKKHGFITNGDAS